MTCWLYDGGGGVDGGGDGGVNGGGADGDGDGVVSVEANGVIRSNFPIVSSIYVKSLCIVLVVVKSLMSSNMDEYPSLLR